MRIGPFARLGSTTFPPWVISTTPRATRRRAAMRAGSIKVCQFSPPTRRAASDGQIDASRARLSSSASIAASSASSVVVVRARRQASEQYFTCSQLRAHFDRHCIVRPQRAHVFSGRSAIEAPDGAAEQQDEDVAVRTHHGGGCVEIDEVQLHRGGRCIGWHRPQTTAAIVGKDVAAAQ